MPIYTRVLPHRTCVTCKYHEQQGSHYHNCLRTATTDIVDGKATFDSCGVARSWPTFVAYLNGTCGRGGRFWEPSAKDPT